MSDNELLELKLGGILLTEMTPITFYQWVAGKISGAPTYNAATQELLGLVRGTPMSRVMAPEEKIRIIRKLEALNIPIP